MVWGAGSKDSHARHLTQNDLNARPVSSPCSQCPKHANWENLSNPIYTLLYTMLYTRFRGLGFRDFLPEASKDDEEI